VQLRFTQFLTALRQAQGFLDANTAALGTINSSGAREALNESVTRLDALAAEQTAWRIKGRGELQHEKRLSRSLRRQQMRPIAKIARAQLPELAQVEAVRMPPQRSNNTDLVARARAMAQAVEPYAATFRQTGLSPDFIERLQAATEALITSIYTKGTFRTNRVGATDAIEKEVQRARLTVHSLDGMVQAQLHERDNLLTKWLSAIQVIGGGTGPTPETSTTAAAAGPAVPNAA